MKLIIYSALAIGLMSSFFLLLKVEFTIPVVYAKQEVGSPILPPISADWVATDGVGRTLPLHSTTGDFKQNKYVGIFYFLLQGQYNDKAVYDISAALRVNPANPTFGPESTWHWWGEPEAGYFKADDPWVIRRNLQLLTLAGVDVLFFDATNKDPYLPTVNKLCEIAIDMRHHGIPVPYICFITYTSSGQTVTTIYEQFYAQNRYSELWFRWQGKPLILGKVEEMINPSIRDFFTWRYSWAWTNTRNEPHHWQWLDRAPQNYGWDKDPSVPEEIPVAVASHPFDNGIGKSFRGGRHLTLNKQAITSQTTQGLYFDEQWKRALQVNPSIVFVTGWNEWVAQRFVNKQTRADAKTPSPLFIGKPIKPGQTYFVDLYNEEYNRDIEPMKGGYTDNYYYQLVANIRRFKGLPSPQSASSAQTIAIDGNFSEWGSVKPIFIDPEGDVAHRNWPRADNKFKYVNNTGRNDIVRCRVAHDRETVYFYAQSATKLTPSSNKNWMLLFIDADQSIKTGWAGYDFLINQSVKGSSSTISRWNGRSWIPVTNCSIRVNNNELELAIPLKVIQQSTNKVKIDFHWTDNIQRLNKIEEFFLSGDSAPDRRFNYRYNSK